MISPFRRNQILPTVAVLVFLGMALLNIRSSHDWGDDFAMYIHQAKNIVLGLPQTDNGYLYSPKTHYYGPKAYSVGFPIFLAPIYAMFGNSIFHFECGVAFLTFTFGILLWIYLSRITKNRFAAFALTAMLAFNPWLIEFKGNVLSDILFANFCLIFCLIFESPQRISIRRGILTGLLLGWALLSRSAGVTLIAAICAHATFEFLFKNEQLKKREVLPYVLVLTCGLTLYAIFQFVLFPSPTLGSYALSIDGVAMLRSISKNGEYYLQTVRDIIPNAGPTVIQTLLYHFVIVGTVFGFFLKIREKIRFEDWFFLFYLALLLIWPGLQGFRLLLPLAPIALGYLFLAATRVFPRATGPETFPKWAVVSLAGITLVFAHPVISIQKKALSVVVDGPQTLLAAEAFDFIKSALPKDAVISFRKPRLLGLYGERGSVADTLDPIESEIIGYYRDVKPDYFLVDHILTEKPIQAFAVQHGKSLWKNARFEVFKSEGL